jgi:fructokinase
MRKVLGFGETVLDIIFKEGRPVAAKPGGSVLNSFITLGRLGWNPCFISEYGTDDVGELIESTLIENGVSTEYVNRFSEGQSALALAFLDDNSNAAYSFYRNFPQKRLQKLPDNIIKDDIVLFGSIYASTSAVRSSVVNFLDSATEKGGLILYDPNFRKAHIGELHEIKPRILENIRYADIIRGSDEDFRLIFGLGDVGEIPDKIDIESKILIYTTNSGEVTVLAGNEQYKFPVENIVPVSTIGAGDSFNAGIIHYLLSKKILKEDLSDLDRYDLDGMVSAGIRFATSVCMSYDNYISREFAGEFLS